MSAYLAVFKARFRVMLQYRAAAAAGVGTQLFWGLLRVMLFDAFMRHSTTAPPMTWSQTLSYLWLIQALLLLQPWRIDPEIVAMVRSGALAYELVRPTDLYWYWFSRQVAAKTAPVLLRALPMFVVAGLFLGLEPPASLASGVAFLVSAFLAMLLGAALATLIAISALWTVALQGAGSLVSTLTYLFSGAVVPLPFYPIWAQRLIDLMPFGSLMDTPFRLYVGHTPPESALPLIGRQVLWIALLVLYGRWVLSRGTRRLVIQGG